MFELEMTDELRQTTRKWFVEQELEAIEAAEDFLIEIEGTLSDERLSSYIAWRKSNIEMTLSGKNDHTFMFLQRAFYIQNGYAPALLSH